MTSEDQHRADALSITMAVNTVANVYLLRLGAWGARIGGPVGVAVTTLATETATQLSRRTRDAAAEHARIFQQARPFQPRVVASK